MSITYVAMISILVLLVSIYVVGVVVEPARRGDR